MCRCWVSKMAVLTFVNKTLSWLMEWSYWPVNRWHADWRRHILVPVWITWNTGGAGTEKKYLVSGALTSWKTLKTMANRASFLWGGKKEARIQTREIKQKQLIQRKTKQNGTIPLLLLCHFTPTNTGHKGPHIKEFSSILSAQHFFII